MKKITFKPKFHHVVEIARAWLFIHKQAVIVFHEADIKDMTEEDKTDVQAISKKQS